VSRRDPAASRSSSTSRRGPRPRTDGKVDVQCPQCAATYRIAEEMLDSKIECGECHRVFFAKTTAGKKVKPPDNTKLYVGIGVGAVALIGMFAILASGGEPPKKEAPPPPPKREVYGRSTHPRTAELVAWAQALSTDNRLVLDRHSDFQALGTALGVANATDTAEVVKALQTHESTKFLRELACDGGELATEADMNAPEGKGIVFVTAKPGDDTYEKRYRGEIELTFRMDGNQTRVTGIGVKVPPVRKKPDPSKAVFKPVKEIAKPTEREITDSAGTRKVSESEPSAVPHWDKATPELQKKADDTVAMVVQSADHDAPGGLFNKATMSVRTLDEKKATVPRALNAMFELYGDVMANNLKLSQLDRALRAWTGFAVNYDPSDTGDAAKDKAARQSSVRQWFAYWYRYGNTELKEHIEEAENLDMPVGDPKKSDPNKAGSTGKTGK
jgi:hypothetical protein